MLPSGIQTASAWPEHGITPGILFEGGWKQNPERMEYVQLELATNPDASRGQYASVGISAFDTIPPFADAEQRIDLPVEEDPILKDINPRMIQRAVLLGSLAGQLLDTAPFTSYEAAVAHCAGANVHLLSRYLHLAYRIGEPLPDKAVLVEPMIAEGIRVMGMAKANKNHEARAAEDKSFVSLQAMQAKTDEAKDGMAAAKPLSDILGSRGVSLLAANTEMGDQYVVILGDHDIAAPKEVIVDQLASRGLESIIRHYRFQKRFGHGYLLEETKRAMQTVKAGLESLGVVQQIVNR